jgi:hypothetical protein
MRREKQFSFFKDMQKREAAFGGSLLKSHPKTARRLSTREPIHLVLRSEKARGSRSFLRGPTRAKQARRLIYTISAKYGFRIYEYANSGNHFHVVLRLYKRFQWKAFICELTSRLAALVEAPSGFWAGRPFTRIVYGWGRNFRRVIEYTVLNQLEAAGVLKRWEVEQFGSA